MGCSSSRTGFSSMDPPWGHKSCQQTCSSVGSSLHRSTGPARSLLQHSLPTGPQPPSGIHLLWHGVFHGLQVYICSTVDLYEPASPWSSPRAIGESLLQHLEHLLRLLLHWSWCLQSCFSPIFSLLSPAAVTQQLCYPWGTTTVADMLSLG